MTPAETVRACFRAWLAKDRAAAESLIAQLHLHHPRRS